MRFFRNLAIDGSEVEGYGEKISLRLLADFYPRPPHRVPSRFLRSDFRQKYFYFGEGKMCFSVILLPGPATFTLLPGEKYLISFSYKSCSNFVLEVSSDCTSDNLGMGGERKEEKRSRYECVRKKLPKKGNGQSIPPAPMLQSCVNIVR